MQRRLLAVVQCPRVRAPLQKESYNVVPSIRGSNAQRSISAVIFRVDVSIKEQQLRHRIRPSHRAGHVQSSLALAFQSGSEMVQKVPDHAGVPSCARQPQWSATTNRFRADVCAGSCQSLDVVQATQRACDVQLSDLGAKVSGTGRPEYGHDAGMTGSCR
eukprot:scaffold11_cov257-Pinguiococcus_pyrenoidosus.AAC.50